MNERLLTLRKTLRLSQEKFGEKIGITGAAVSRLESGERALTESTIKLICATFNVSNEWMKSGVGEIFNKDPEAELDYLIGQLLAADNPFRKRFITHMMKLTDAQWEAVEKFIREVSGVED